MAPIDVAVVVAGGLLVSLVAVHQLSGQRLRRLEREIAADEAAREAAGRPAE